MITATSLGAEQGLSGWLLLKDQLGLDCLGKDSSGHRHLGTSSGGKKYDSWPNSQGRGIWYARCCSKSALQRSGHDTVHRAGRKTGVGQAREWQVEKPERAGASLDLRAFSCKPFRSRSRTEGPEEEGDLLKFLPSQ